MQALACGAVGEELRKNGPGCMWGSCSLGWGGNWLLPTCSRAELLLAERDRSGGVARGGVVPIEVLIVVVRVCGAGVASEDGVVAFGGNGWIRTLIGVHRAVADEVTETCQTEG